MYESPGRTCNGQIPGIGSTRRDLFHDDFDALGCASGHGVSLFVNPIERRDFAREGIEYFGVFAGAVRAGMSDAGADEDGECVLSVFGDGAKPAILVYGRATFARVLVIGGSTNRKYGPGPP